jgi:hypothetical protein
MMAASADQRIELTARKLGSADVPAEDPERVELPQAKPLKTAL